MLRKDEKNTQFMKTIKHQLEANLIIPNIKERKNENVIGKNLSS